MEEYQALKSLVERARGSNLSRDPTRGFLALGKRGSSFTGSRWVSWAVEAGEATDASKVRQ